MAFQEYPKWITDRRGVKRIVENRQEEKAAGTPPKQPKPVEPPEPEPPDQDAA